jgi:putative SOS response-associated peptidase YedK
MCGRITQKTGELPGLVTITAFEPLIEPFRPRYNGAPSLNYWVIRRHPETGNYHRDLLIWGFIPSWTKDPGGGRRPINARAEGISTSGMFRKAYARRRCLIPIDNFFEWRAIKGQKWKQPYAIAMKSGEPFALGAVWESWTRPTTGEVVRSFAIVTTSANEAVGVIHDRMPVIVAPESYARWLGIEPDPYDLLQPYPSEPMTIWPIGRKVGSPANDTPDILDPIDVPGTGEP